MAVFSKEEWFSNISNDLLAGIVVALALIPEAIAFSIIAGLDPKVACMPRLVSVSSLLLLAQDLAWSQRLLEPWLY